MEHAFKVYVRIDNRKDNQMPSIILDIVKSRHRNFIVEGMVEGYWRGFMEETFAVVIHDHEDLVNDTVEQIREELDEDYITVVELGNVNDMS